MNQENNISQVVETFRSPFFRAIIYDLDGLLVDSEDLWYETAQRVLNDYGIQIGEEVRIDLAGRGNLSSYFIEKFKISEEKEVMRGKIWNTFYELAKSGLKPMPGAIESVLDLSNYFDLAIATSAHVNYAEMVIDMFNLKEKFRVMIGGDQVERAKPYPDVFLKVAKEINTKPAECLVLEDSPNGIEAAKSAGMLCISVPNQALKNADFSNADLIIASLEELKMETIVKLLSD